MEEYKILFDLLKDNKYDQFEKYLNKEKDIDINIRDETGNYLLTYAIIKNNIEIVKLLLSKGCRIDITDQEGKSILYLPIKYNYNDIIDLLIDYNKHSIGISIIDVKDTRNNIALHYSIIYKNINAIDILLKANSNPNIVDENGNNSLHLAVYTKKYEICKKIINQDVNINAKTAVGETALHIAINFQLESIIKLLIDNGIDINSQDYNNEITPLIYAVNLNNKNIAKLLLYNQADPNIQDFVGNTAIHYTVIEEMFEILLELLNSEKFIRPNFNIYNLNGKLPLHLLLEKDKIYENQIMEKLINVTNLNFQDGEGNTPFHHICSKKIWRSYKDILVKKKINCFIKNHKKKRPIDFIPKNEINEFLEMMTNSYLYVLRNYNTVWKEQWENLCNKELFYDQLNKQELNIINEQLGKNYNKKDNTDVCYHIVNNKLNEIYKENTDNQDNQCDSNTSYPLKKSRKCINIAANTNSVELCNFIGSTLDILMGLIYLLKKYNYACSTLTSNFMINKDLCNYYTSIGINANNKCEFMNFEIVWIYKKLFFSENFVNNFKKCINDRNVRFIIIPLGIEILEGNHANYLIFDKKTYEIERFEPYGSASPYKFNYNSKLLDNVLTYKFNEIDTNIKYISPDKYLPKIGFQYLDSYETRTRKIGDPGGFCALWSIWYTDMRLQYPDVDRKALVNKLLKEIKLNNISFKNLIRNYSINITEIRDSLFKLSEMTINDWINDQYTEEQFAKLINGITKLLNNYIK